MSESKKYTVEVVIRNDDYRPITYVTEFTLTRDELDNKGRLAYLSLDAMEYLVQEMKRHDIKKDIPRK